MPCSPVVEVQLLEPVASMTIELGSTIPVSGLFLTDGSDISCVQVMTWNAQQIDPAGAPLSFFFEGNVPENTAQTKNVKPTSPGVWDLWVSCIWGFVGNGANEFTIVESKKVRVTVTGKNPTEATLDGDTREAALESGEASATLLGDGSTSSGVESGAASAELEDGEAEAGK